MNKIVQPASLDLESRKPHDAREPEFRAVRLPGDHPRVEAGRLGVLITNLGTPEATSYWPMRAYLKEFLSDKRVIETPRWLWWPILNLIILQTRPKKKGRDYDLIWNKERNEGPLKTITRSQAEQAQAYMNQIAHGKVVVDWAMRYGKPAVKPAMENLLAQGCDRILVVPMYPQYSAATSATACDKGLRGLDDHRAGSRACASRRPTTTIPVYIDALASSIEEGAGQARLRAGVSSPPSTASPQVPAPGRPLPFPLAANLACCAKTLGWPAERW